MDREIRVSPEKEQPKSFMNTKAVLQKIFKNSLERNNEANKTDNPNKINISRRGWLTYVYV